MFTGNQPSSLCIFPWSGDGTYAIIPILARGEGIMQSVPLPQLWLALKELIVDNYRTDDWR